MVFPKPEELQHQEQGGVRDHHPCHNAGQLSGRGTPSWTGKNFRGRKGASRKAVGANHPRAAVEHPGPPAMYHSDAQSPERPMMEKGPMCRSRESPRLTCCSLPGTKWRPTSSKYGWRGVHEVVREATANSVPRKKWGEDYPHS